MADRPQEEYSEYVEAWRKRLAQEESERRMRAKRLREVAQACAHHLVEDFGARKVYLFGSLLGEDVVHSRSDIDLAVEGLEGARYFEALSALWKLLPAGVELDLVPLEDAWPSLAEQVSTEGKLLAVAD
ncbi:MAG: nucleotidyltransferase family protein [Anaerolineae bacterium]